MTKNPFMRTRDCFGREEQYFSLADFGEALAKEIGAKVEIAEPGPYGNVRLSVEGGRMRLGFSMGYGAKAERITISAYLPQEQKLDFHARSKLPTISVDRNREIAAIGRDVTRRIVEPSRPLLAASEEKIAAKEATAARLLDLCAELEAQFPGLSAAPRGENEITAPIYYNHDGAYLTGTLYADGHMTFERVSLKTPEGARGLLAALVSEAGGPAR